MQKVEMRHEPYLALKGFLRERGLTYKDLADILGISVTAVGQKINGQSDFTLSEATTIKARYQPERDIFL